MGFAGPGCADHDRNPGSVRRERGDHCGLLRTQRTNRRDHVWLGADAVVAVAAGFDLVEDTPFELEVLDRGVLHAGQRNADRLHLIAREELLDTGLNGRNGRAERAVVSDHPHDGAAVEGAVLEFHEPCDPTIVDVEGRP